MTSFRLRRIPLFLAALGLLLSSCAQLTEQFENLPKLSKKDLRFKLAQSSRIYDRDGNVLTTLHETENRTIVPLRAMPKHLRRAVVAIEDERFYQHKGVDWRAIVRAALTNVASGEIREGGSTITQQYVKNVIIAPGQIAEKTLRRKIVEASLSAQLEKKLSKKEILGRYLNTVYFGEGAYGVQAAALTYFGKSVNKLTLSQSATLAGVIRSPVDYDPFRHPNASKRRRNVVLAKMDELRWANPRRIEKAKRSGLGVLDAASGDEYPAPYFMDYVQRLITYDPRFDAVGSTIQARTDRLFQGGLEIHTTIDQDMQIAAEDAVESVLPYRNDPYASLVAVDPKTGHVMAMVGGRDWFASKKQDPYAKLNLAILAEPSLGCLRAPSGKGCDFRAPGTGRQAGSAFKPFALAAALESGIPLSKTYDAAACMTFPNADNGGPWDVCNYESSEFGSSLPLLEATVNSVNVVYAQLILEVGAEEVVTTADAMGINTELQPVNSAALGTNPVNALGMASAYGTLATNGVYNPPVAITEIIDGTTGKVIYKDTNYGGEQVIDEGVAYLTTTALEQVVQRGTGVQANIGRPVAGKTGTAQEYRDAWFAGYTPDLSAAVWMGYPEGEIEMKSSCVGSTQTCRVTRSYSGGTGVTGGTWPAIIWHEFMERAVAGMPVRGFETPDISIVTVTIDARTGCLASRFTPDEYAVSATFASGTEPEAACRAPRTGVRVPDVFSFPADDAEAVLDRAGFDVARVLQPDDDYPPGRVIGQDPPAGARAPFGSTVTIFVSTTGEGGGGGGDTASVPGVLGYSRGAAEGAIRNAGLRAEVIVQSESSRGQAKKNRNRVWKQSPPGGTRVSEGSTVTIWVNP